MKITDAQKELIIAGFGKHYTGKAIEFLTGEEIFNSQAEPFTPVALKHIVNGNTENVIVVNSLVARSVEILEDKNQADKQIKRKVRQLIK